MNPKVSPYRSDLDDSMFILNYFVYVQTWLSFKKTEGLCLFAILPSTKLNRQLHNLPGQVVEMSQRQDQP